MSISVIHYLQCPVCNSSQIGPALQCKDYTVSKENFEVWECKNCMARFTQQVPDAESIGPYYASENYISHSDTSKGLISKLYKTARKYTLAKKVKGVAAASGLTNGNLLDVGCGTGAFLDAAKRAGWKVTGLEPDALARRNAQKLYGIEPLEASQLYQLPAASFDVITLWHVLEHIHDLQGYFEQFNRLLKPGGTLIIAVPNYLSKDAANYGEYWAAYDVPRHLYHFTPKSIEIIAANNGLAVHEVQPMWLDAFYIALLSEQYQHGSQRLVPAFFSGLNSVWNAARHKGTCSSQVYVLRSK
ncbi:MAG TPA: class I SAM-dependent methyltransferase [Phnomibacter sp.]|nr:class I SAM-dependent methyltransferase [Phnomibacter sp.]